MAQYSTMLQTYRTGLISKLTQWLQAQLKYERSVTHS
jgi:hypothetical protein